MDEHLLALEKKLIGFDTVSVNPTAEMVDYLAERLKSAGFRVDAWAGPQPGKVNLFATLGPVDVSGVMLSGHMDVVPVEGQAWVSDPFSLASKDGRHFGRGTADMKTFIAQAVLAAEAVKARKFRLPLHLAFTYDEEIGCAGAEHLVKSLAEVDYPLPLGAVIGEPTGFQVFRMHKGFVAAEVVIKGVEGHSSKPGLGANAISAAAGVVAFLDEVARERAQNPTMAADFEIPHTTVNVGTISGGTALNIIPNKCVVRFECRPMPEEDPDFVFNQVQAFIDDVARPRIQAEHAEADIQIKQIISREPMMTPPGTRIEALALELTGKSHASAAPFYTEGGIYNSAGIPTVICGPGDIDQAHRPNEFITSAQLEQGVPFLGRLIEKVCF